MSHIRSRKDTEAKSLCIETKTYVVCEMYDYVGIICSHRNSDKDLNKTLELIPRIFSIDLLQKIAVLRTSHVI